MRTLTGLLIAVPTHRGTAFTSYTTAVACPVTAILRSPLWCARPSFGGATPDFFGSCSRGVRLALLFGQREVLNKAADAGACRVREVFQQSAVTCHFSGHRPCSWWKSLSRWRYNGGQISATCGPNFPHQTNAKKVGKTADIFGVEGGLLPLVGSVTLTPQVYETQRCISYRQDKKHHTRYESANLGACSFASPREMRWTSAPSETPQAPRRGPGTGCFGPRCHRSTAVVSR